MKIQITKTEAKSIMSLARKVQTAQEGTSSPTPSEKPAKKAPAKATKKAPVSVQEAKLTRSDKKARNSALLRRCHGLIGHGSRESLEQALRELPDTTDSWKKMRANAQAKLDALA